MFGVRSLLTSSICKASSAGLYCRYLVPRTIHYVVVSGECSLVGRSNVFDNGMWTLPYDSIDLGVAIFLRALNFHTASIIPQLK